MVVQMVMVLDTIVIKFVQLAKLKGRNKKTNITGGFIVA